MKRKVTHELLDDDSISAGEVAVALADLRAINRRFGGLGTAESLVRQISAQTGSTSLSLLEVAAGSGYVPMALSRLLGNHSLRLQVTLLDRVPSHLRNGSETAAPRVAADALSLPFADSSFDVVSCCLFAHHLQPDELVQFVNEGLRVCRVAVMINDIVRGPVHLLLVYAAFPLFHSYITRHDAPASVRQAYTREEMENMLLQTRAARIEVHRYPLFRMGAIAWKRTI